MTAQEMNTALSDVIEKFKISSSKAINYCANEKACYAVSETQKAFITALDEIRCILVNDKMDS